LAGEDYVFVCDFGCVAAFEAFEAVYSPCKLVVAAGAFDYLPGHFCLHSSTLVGLCIL